MTEALSLPLPEDAFDHEQPVSAARTPLRSVPSNDGAGDPIEILAPDRFCAALLLEQAAATYPAELLRRPGWAVRMAAPSGREWMPEVTALVQRWLDSIPLPCTRVFHGDRSYVIRASAGGPARAVAATALEDFPETEAILSRRLGAESTHARPTGR